MDGQQGLVGGDAESIGCDFKYEGQNAEPGAAKQQPFNHQTW